MYKILVIVDMQNDFLDEKVLGNKDCREVVRRIVEKLQQERYQEIILTRDTHEDNYLETQEGRKLPVRHCIRGTPGWEIADAIQEAVKKAAGEEETSGGQSDTIVRTIDKPTFGSLALADEIALASSREETSVELVGVCTGICVISNALLIKAKSPEVPVAVDASCCACVTPQSHQTALDAMKLCQIEIK